MPTSFLSSIKDNIAIFKVYVLPGEPVDLAHSAHCKRYRPEVVLGIWIGCQNNPQDILLGRYITSLLLYRKKFKPADHTFQAMIDMAPENPSGYYRLGLLKQVQGQYDPALKNFDRALKINPKLMDVFTGVVLVYSAQKDFGQALERCARQLETVKDSPMAAAIGSSTRKTSRAPAPSADSLIALRSTWVELQGTQTKTLGLGRRKRDV